MPVESAQVVKAGAGTPVRLAFMAWVSHSSRATPRLRAVPARVSMRSTKRAPCSLSTPRLTFRHITTLLDPKAAPAVELATLYPERWEIESTFDELETHLRGRQMLLGSKTPDLIRQEFYGLMMTHFAIWELMHEAALQAKLDPDRLSLTHAVRVVRRTLPHFAALSPQPNA